MMCSVFMHVLVDSLELAALAMIHSMSELV